MNPTYFGSNNVVFRVYYSIMRSKLFFLGVFVFLQFCKEDEKPKEDISRMTITGLELATTPTPGGRLQASTTWTHTYPSEIAMVFREIQSGKTHELRINPNEFTTPYSIELPYGSYTYEGKSADSNTGSAFLPITLKGEFQISTPTSSLIAKAFASHGLLTFSKRNLANPPNLTGSTGSTFFEKSGFYYSYVPGSGISKVEMTFTSGKKIRIPVSPLPFTHNQFQFRLAGDSDPDTFLPKDFSINQRNFTLSAQGYPTELISYAQVELPSSQRETSGLAWIQGKLFSINDGGNPAEIYELNPQTGAVNRTIRVEGTSNEDWEDLATSSTHLFIGDFGNNAGNRTNLRILKISIQALLSQNSVHADLIEFSYPDQVQFNPGVNAHNFDCEAIAFANGQLHLFSKNWQDNRTKHYTLPESPGKYVANLVGNVDTQGLITAADISADGKNLVLLGYENSGILSRSFIWTFPSFGGANIGSTEGFRFFLGSPANLGQTEGIVFMNSPETKISGEGISLGGVNVPPKLFELDLHGIFIP